MKMIESTAAYPAASLTAIAAALLTMFSPAYGQSEMAARTDELRQDLATPESRIALGLGALSGAGRRFGQYNGLHKDGAYGLFDLDLVGRDEASGTWLKLKGRNLGLDNRELRFDHEQQGRWAYYFGVSQFKDREPLIVNTGLQGIGAASQTVSALAPKRTVDLSRTYDNYSFGSRSFFGSLPNGSDRSIPKSVCSDCRASRTSFRSPLAHGRIAPSASATDSSGTRRCGSKSMFAPSP